MNLTWDEVVNVLTPPDKARRAALRQQMHRLEYERPDPPAAAFAVANMSGEAPVTYVLKAGDHKQKLGAVAPGLVKVISGDAAAVPLSGAGRRSALANWLASPAHPLTARVMVNRIWQFRMGTGLVAHAQRFRAAGRRLRRRNRPLLDWLAAEFVDHGWSIKHIDRLIVTSSAYRQVRERRRRQGQDRSGQPPVLAHEPQAPGSRDCSATPCCRRRGDLNPKMGGSPVRIPIEPEVYDLIFTEGERTTCGPSRSTAPSITAAASTCSTSAPCGCRCWPISISPMTMTSCPVRPVSTHALQALSLFNGDFHAGAVRSHVARGWKRSAAPDGTAPSALAYRLALARPPQPHRTGDGEATSSHVMRSLADFCLALLNRNEFVYVP